MWGSREQWVPNTLGDLPAGIAGTRRTLDLMRQLARQGSTNLAVRQKALTLVAPLAQKDFVGELNAMFVYVRDNIRYVRDVAGVETLQDPAYTLSRAAGDCDDKATLLAAMLLSTGHPARFVAVGFQTPDQCEHVYLEGQPSPGGQWIPMDPTEPKPLGWAPVQDREPTKMIITEI